MAVIKKDGGYNALPIAYKRGNPIALDTTAVWYSQSELETYAASGATAYVGQILALVDEENNKAEAYVIADATGTLVKLAQTAASGDLAADVAALQTALGHPAEAQIGEVGDDNYKAAVAATGIYKIIADADAELNSDIEDINDILDVLNGEASIEGSVAEAKAAADAAQADVDALESIVGTQGDYASVYSEIGNLKTADTAMDGRLEALEATHAKVGGDGADKNNFKTVAQEAAAAVAAVVNGANESFDTLKEIADWIGNDTTGAASMANDISALKTAVGDSDSGLLKDVNDLKDLTAGDFSVGDGDNETTDIKHYIDNEIANIADNLGDLAALDAVSVNDIDSNLSGIINNKADKPESVVAGNFAGLDENGDLTDSGKKAADFATAAQGTKADSAVQTVKVNNSALTATDNAVNITITTGSANGNIAVNGSDVAVKGLGSAAYTEASAYDAAGAADAVLGTSADADTVATVYGVKAAVAGVKTTADNNATLLTTINGADTVDGSFRKAAKDAANAVLGSSGDAATANTVYGAKAAVISAKGDLIGAATDAKSANTIYGAKAYADDAAATAKSTIEGAATDASTASTIYGAKAFATAAVASEVSRADSAYVAKEDNKRLMTSDEGTKLADISAEANKVTATAKSGKISIDGTEVQIIPDNNVVDADYAHITVTSSSVSDGTNTFEKYVHPTTTAVNAAAVKVGKDSSGHVVIGDALAASDIGAEAAFTDGSASIASITDGVVTIKAGIKQSAGAIAQGDGDDITLAKVATSAAAADISIADTGNKITAENVENALVELTTNISTNASAITTLNGAASVSGSVAKAVADAKSEILGNASSDTKDSNTLAGVKKYADSLDTAMDGRVDALEALHAEKTGSGYQTVAEEVATGIATVVANADSDFDTLKEVADWILSDTTGAAKMQSDISTLKTTVGDASAGLVKNVADNASAVTALQTTLGSAGSNGEESTGIVKDVEDLQELAPAEANAQVNDIETIAINGSNLDIYNKTKDTEYNSVKTYYSNANGDVWTFNWNTDLYENSGSGYVKTSDVSYNKDHIYYADAEGTLWVSNWSTGLYEKSSSSGEKVINIKIAEGSFNGTIAVNGSNVKVHGLGSAAYTEASAYDAAGAANAVLGSSGDTATANTVYGAIAKVNAVLGTSDDTATNATVYGAIAKANAVLGSTDDASTAKTVYGAIALANSKDANVIESITINGSALSISNKSIALPLATASALGLVQVDNSSIQVSNAGVISIKAVSTDLLSQGTDTLVFNGGTAST